MSDMSLKPCPFCGRNITDDDIHGGVIIGLFI